MTNAEEEPYFCIECKEEIEQCKHDEELIHIGKASRQAEIIEMIKNQLLDIGMEYGAGSNPKRDFKELERLKQQILENQE